MPTYQVDFSNAAYRQFAKLPQEMKARVAPAIQALRDDPRPAGVKRLSGPSGAWRIRVGIYRVAYMIEDDHLVVLVVRIGPRRDVYRGL
jgi:mRNA interferase RelE/StbE